MDKTIEGNWVNEMATIKNEFDFDISNQYFQYFQHISQRIENNSLMNSIDIDNIDKEFWLEHKIPLKRNYQSFKRNIYAQRITKMKGVVKNLHEDFFSAFLYDSSNIGTYEEVELDFIDVDKDDLELLSEGAVFYWSLGHFLDNGQVKKVSEIRFQRIKSLDVKSADRIIDEASKLNKSVTWD